MDENSFKNRLDTNNPVGSTPIPTPPTPPPTIPSPTIPQPTQKTAPANPPTKNIFFNQPTDMMSSPASFKGGRMSDLQSKVDFEIKESTEQKPKNIPIKNVRTYEGDVADVLSHRKTSATTIALAESKRRDGVESIKTYEAPPETSGSTGTSIAGKIFIFIISLVLLGGGAFGGYYLYSKSVLAPSGKSIVVTYTSKSLLSSDNRVVISIASSTRIEALTKIQRELYKPQAPNTIKEIVLTKNGVDMIPALDMIDLMQINVPNILKRSIAPEWMLGSYSDPSGNTSYFVIVTNDFFQNAFTGMLQWENIIVDDLKTYIAASSTRGQFISKIIKNNDVREFKSDDGQILFLYTFINGEKLIFAGNESAISEIVNRLEKEVYLR